MGNGLTPTESSGGEWIEPFAYAVHGAMIYINASPGQIVDGGFAIGGTPTNRPAAYVLNSEEENDGPPEGARFEGCNSLDVSWGFAIWGNEKKPNVVIQRAAMIDGVLISDNGSKIHPNAVVLNYDDTGTLLIKPADLPANVLANLRSLADRLAAAYRDHADAEEITAARVALGAAFAALRGPVVVEPPPIDRAALLALVVEGQALAVAQHDWLVRLGTLVGK
jgi:hypothetical protein